MSVSFPCVAISSRKSFLIVDGLETLAGYVGDGRQSEPLGLLDGEGTYWPVSALSSRKRTWKHRLGREQSADLAVGAPKANGVAHAVQQLCDVVDHTFEDPFGAAGFQEVVKRWLRSAVEAKELIEVVGLIGLLRDVLLDVE